jgi:hypothetical protein
MNAEWHKAHRMPASPTLEQRMAWHAEHIKHCDCREIPPKLAAEMKKRGLLKDSKKANAKKR